jgi:hypothetical protein
MKRPDYEARSEEAAQAFVDSGSSLQDSIVKIARRDSMNPEQVKRLVEMSNTATFLKLFGKTAGESDRVVDFEVADPARTVQAFYAEGKGAEDTQGTSSSSYFDDVANEYAPPAEKVAAYEPPAENERVALRRTVRDKLHGRIRDQATAELLRTKMAEATYSAETAANELGAMFRGIYGRDKHAQFEEDALALFGPPAVVPLSDVRSKIGMPLFTRVPSEEAVKLAAERVVVDASGMDMVVVSRYLGHVASYKEAQAALESLVE